MKSSSSFFTAAAAILIVAASANAARVDFNDPRRALGREDNIRIDAELSQENVSANSSLSVTYQVENLGKTAIAIADKQTDVSYDSDTQTITFSIGAEVPAGATMPHLIVIKPGETKTLQAGGAVHVAVPHLSTPWSAVPRYVMIKVNVLKDVVPFADLIAKQTATIAPPLPGDLFDKWVNSVDSVFLNALPVRWGSSGPDPMAAADASRRGPGSGRF